jgi:PGF-CTERM protein
VFAGATSDMVQVRYTWLVSARVTTVKSSDKFGIMEVVTVNSTGKSLSLNNTDSTLSLTQDSTVDIMGNMKFKVADQAGVLRFYPMVEYEIKGVTPPGTPSATPGVGTPSVTPVKTPLANATVTTPEANVTAAAAVATTAAAAATTKGEPGFEAIYAIAGLLAVAFLVLRQRK